eukprot:SAG31_NODE_3021_length_4780_cov_10.795770_3_plen_258_part_00
MACRAILPATWAARSEIDFERFLFIFHFHSTRIMSVSKVMRGKDGAERHVFIFSCWDADTAHRVGWTVDMDDQGNGCSRFGGEGTGSHCMLAVPPVQGIKYSFKVAFDGKNESGAFWTGKLTSTEPSTGVERVQTVGTLFYPHLPKMVGFGQFKIQSDDFLEYFLGGDCAKAVDVAVGISGPYFNGKTVTPLQAYPAYGTVGPNSCNRSAVRRSAGISYMLTCQMVIPAPCNVPQVYSRWPMWQAQRAADWRQRCDS